MSGQDEELKEAWRALPKEMNFFDTGVVLPLNVF